MTTLLSMDKAHVRLLRVIGRWLAASVQTLITELKLASRTMAGRFGLSLVLMHLTLALVGEWLAPYPPTEFHLDHQLEAPSWQFWFGTDQFGRDILSRTMSGARSIIGISVAGTALGVGLGTIVGMSSGYKGGKTDEFVMRIVDGMMAFPTLLLAIIMITTLGSSAQNIVIALGFVFMPRTARVMRVTVLELKPLEFVQSARLRGEPAYYVIFREILPNTVPTLAVEASIRLSYAVLIASSLGFLGLGVQPPSPDWGLMIAESQILLADAPWIAFAPMAAVTSLIVGVNLLYDGIRQARDLPLMNKPE